MVESLNEKEINDSQDFEGELEDLKKEFLEIKNENFRANSELKNEIKCLGFYNGDESGEYINFNINNIKKYLESIKNKSWSDLDVKSSELEKGVRTIAIQIAINYINTKNGGATNDINLIDGIRGNQTWKGVKEFQTTYELKNKDGLPGHETITKTLELLNRYSSANSPKDNSENQEGLQENQDNNGGENEEYIEKEDFIESRLNHGDIDNNKCLNLFKNLKINGLNNKGWDNRWIDFENKLNDRFVDQGGIEGIILQNPEIGKLLSAIVSHQSKEIENMKSRHVNKKQENDEESDSNKEDSVQTWEDYKYENASLDSFEEFILSNEGIAIIIDEIKSHIDTKHENENGEYFKFNEKDPFSLINLEVKLKNAREDKIHWDYYEKNRPLDLEKMAKLHILSNKITGYVDKLVGDYRKLDKEIFNQDMVTTLESFLSKGIYGAGIIEMFSGEGNKDLRDTFQGVLSDSIKSYEGFVRNQNDEFILNTGNKQTELQLKSYLYLYGRIFYPTYFKANKDPKYYEDILPDIMKVIISNDDKSLLDKIKYKEFLEVEKKLKEERQKRDLQNRREAARRNREMNRRLKSAPKMDEYGNINKIHTFYLDPNNATGPELAAEADLGKELSDYNLNIEESEDRLAWRKEAAFIDARRNFIKSNNNIRALITQEDMHRIFDINANIINISEWDAFKKSSPLLKDLPPHELEKIYTILEGFSFYLNDSYEKLSNNSSKMKEKVDETVKNYAIGAIIDNVRDTFDVITDNQNGNSEGFKLDNDTPIEKLGDDIIISGNFNGTEVKVRYNLKTGNLFMNSFLHRSSQNKISIGSNSSLDYPIGNIKPFNEVLNDYYKLPQHSSQSLKTQNGPQNGGIGGNNPTNNPESPDINIDQEDILPSDNSHRSRPAGKQFTAHSIDRNRTDQRRTDIGKLLDSQVALIGEAIKNNTESQTQKNSAIIKFMKTFNVISDNGQFGSWDFNKGSNLYDIIDIIENTGDIKNGNIQSLEYFNNTFMPKVMEYSGLKWGERNEHQNKTKERSEKIFNYEGDNENIKYLRDKTKDFNPDQFSGVANFESRHQLGFADLIKEKIITGNDVNKKLDISKMEQFIKDIETVDKEVDTKLDEQLANIN